MLVTGTMPANITLRAIAPFILEGTCLLIIFTLAILLAISFVSSHINILFENYKEFKENLNEIKTRKALSTINYPSPSPLPSVTKLPPLYPTPVNRLSEESVVNKNEICDSVLQKICQNSGTNFRQISYDSGVLVSYNSYRHKLIEETLQKQYGGDYAPGNVILNLIQLNTADSGASVILSKKYDINFFEDVKIVDNTAVAINLVENSDSRLKNMEYPDPLTHFIPRNSRKPSTAEIHTETEHPSEISVAKKSSGISSARSNTPTSCQRIIPKRSREANYPFKSPYVTPVHSQTPLRQKPELNSSCNGEAVNLIPNARLRDQAPLTEQLYKRNDTRPDVVSRTHVEAEEYLNRIAKNKRYDITTLIQEPRIRSSLKKSKQHAYEGMKVFNDDHKVGTKKIGDSIKIRRSVKDNVRHNLSSSKPTIWNN